MGLKTSLARTSLAGAMALVVAFGIGVHYANGPATAASGEGAGAGDALPGIFVLALDQRDYNRSAVFWWSGWDGAPRLLLRTGANPQLAVDPLARHLYLAETRGSGLEGEDYLAVYEILPGSGAAPELKLKQKVTVIDRVRYREPVLAPFLSLREGGGRVYLTGRSGPSTLDSTAWVDGYDANNLQVTYKGGRFPGLTAPRLLLPRQDGEVKVVLWSGNQFLALGREGGVLRDWTVAGAGGLLASTVRMAALSPDGKRIYAFGARSLSWFAWDKGWKAARDLDLPEGWQVTRWFALLSLDGKRVYAGVAPREQAVQGRLREVWAFDAETGDVLDRATLHQAVDGATLARDGNYLIAWDRASEQVMRLDFKGKVFGSAARLDGWVPVWTAP